MARTDVLDLRSLRLVAGQGRRLALDLALGPLEFGGERYETSPATVTAVVDVSRMTGGGCSLRLRFAAALEGPCMRCLQPAAPIAEVDAREVHQPGGGDELTSPYLGAPPDDDLVDLARWARDAYALALPAQVLCRADCAGLCPECGADLNDEPGHRHEPMPDPRWAKLRELELE